MKQSGPNAPLNKASASKYDSSVVQSITEWNKAGIPKGQLVLGIPFYGTALKTSRAINSSTGLYVKLASPSAIKGDQNDELSADACPGAKKSYSGSYQWRSIVSAGVLDSKNGWRTYWDSVSSTPYAYHIKDKKFLSFDDAKSLKDKVEYVQQQSLGGAMVWSLEMDDSSSTLLDSIQGVRK
jgi:chitinase